MANRHQDYEPGRGREYRGRDEGNEAESYVRGGNYDQGRVQYGRDTDEQSGSTGRYAGYGDWGQGDYDRSGGGANTGQNRYGMTGHGGRDQGYGRGNYDLPERGGSGSHYGRPDYGRSNQGSGRYDRERGGNYGSGEDSGRGGRDSDYGYGYGGQGGSSRSGGSGRGWNEPYGEGQQYGGAERGWESGGSQYGGAQRGPAFGQRAGSGHSSGYAGPGFGYGGSGTSQSGGAQYGGSQYGADTGGEQSGSQYGGTTGSMYGNYGGGSQFRQGQGLHRGKGPKGYQRSDDRVKEMICERLRDDPHIDASEITVNVSAGKVTLEGTVDSRHAKNAAEDIVEQCGCEDVQNNLRVQRGQGSESSTGSSGRPASTDKDKDRGESARQRH